MEFLWRILQSNFKTFIFFNSIPITHQTNILFQKSRAAVGVYSKNETLNVIKSVSDLQQVVGFLCVLRVSSTKKTDCHAITEILLKVVLVTTNPNQWDLDFTKFTMMCTQFVL
jgi:hypothetical protein